MRKQNPATRLVALWMVFLMLLTPLLEHGGMPEKVKAAVGTSITCERDISLPDGVASITHNETDGVVTPTGFTVTTPVTANLYTLCDNIQFNLIDVKGAIEYNSKTYDILTSEIKIFIGAKTAATEKMSGSETGLLNSDATIAKSDLTDNKIYVYARVLSAKNGDDIENFTSITDYTKVAEYTVGSKEYTAKWQNNGSDTQGDKYYNSAKLTYNPAESYLSSDIFLDKMIGLSKNSGDELTDDDWTPAVAVNSIEVNTTGTYYGYVAAVSNDGTILKTYEAGVVNIDADAPNVTGVNFKLGNDSEAVSPDTDSKLYVDKDTVSTGNSAMYIYFSEEHPVTSDAEGLTDLYVTIGGKNKSVIYNGGTTPNYEVSKVFDELTLNDGDEYSVVAYFKDTVGNVYSGEICKICIIDKDTKITHSITGTGYNSKNLPTEASAQIGNNELTLNATITSGNPITEIKLSGTGFTEYTVPFANLPTAPTNGIYTYNNFEYKFADEVEYKDVKLSVTAGGETKDVEINGVYKYDKTIPNIVYKGIYQKNDDGTYKDINKSLSEAGDYYVDSTSIYFIFDASDVNGVESVNVVGNENNIISASLKSVRIGEANADSYYVAEIDNPSLYVTTNGEIANGETEKKVTLKAYSVDKATNKSTEVSLPNMVEPDKNVKVEALLYNEDNEIVDLTTNQNTNEQYKLLITASSGYDIKNVALSYNGEEKYTYATFDTTSYDEVTKRYTVTKTITLPESVDKNDILTDMKVVVTDKNVGTANIAVGTLLFDQTKPVVDIKDINGSSIGAEWYGPTFAGIKASITSGSQATESSIDSTTVMYSISGAADATNNVSGKIDGVDATGTPVTVTILGTNIPESDDVRGTTITINAKDKAGNPLDTGNTVTIKMDKTEPELTEVLVNGVTCAEYTDKYPMFKVKVTAEDRLTLYEIGYRLEKWNGSAYVDAGRNKTSSTYIDATGGKASATLEFDICGYNNVPLEDGKYKLIVYAKDKAGNEKEQEIEFEVDGALSEKHTLYVINDNTSSSALTETQFGDGTEPLISKNKHSIMASFTSSKKITSAELYVAGVGGAKEKLNATVYLNSACGENGLYYGELKYTFGDGTGKVYSDIQLIVKDEDSKDDDTTTYLDIDLGDFVYDCTAPKVTCKGLYISRDNGTTWSKVTDLYYNTYTVDATASHLYRYVFDVEESGSGIDDTKAYIYCGDTVDKMIALTPKEASAPNTDADITFVGTEYYAQFDTNKVEGHISGAGAEWWPGSGLFLTYRVNVEDKASNVYGENYGESKDVTPIVRLSDNNLRATATLQYLDGTAVDILDANTTYINKASELVVTVTSAYPVNTIELYSDFEGSNEALYNSTYTVSDDENKAAYSADTKLYVVKHKFAIPKDTDVNELINSLGMKVTDQNTDTSKNTYTASIGTLLYDQTKPVITNDNATDKLFIKDTTWYTSYDLSATIKSGDQVDVPDSSIKEATYTITDSVNGDVENQAISVNAGIAQLTNFQVPMSNSADGTKIVFAAKDEAGNLLETNNVAYIRVDNKAPELTLDINKNIFSEDGTVLTPISQDVKIEMSAKDTLALAEIDVLVTKKDGTVVGDKTYSYGDLEALKNMPDGISLTEVLDLKLADGNYTLVAYAKDKAGNSSGTKTINFIVDGTVPVVTAKVASGTMGGKKPLTNFDGSACDYYYRSDVTVQFTYDDDNMNSQDVKVTHNGSPITVSWNKDDTGKYVASYPVSSNGIHTFNISATDRAGNPATDKSITFVKDSVAPELSAIVNGGIVVTNTTGQLMLTSDTTVALSVSDTNEDAGDLNYQTIKSVPDQPVMTSSYLKTTNRSFSFAEEADYTFNAYSIDMAGNQSAVKTVSFRLDKTAPNLSIGGISANGTSSNPVTLSFNMQELFWRDASGHVTIYRKAGDGSVESLMEEFDYTPTAYQSSIARNISESGIYRVEFNAQDRIGHSATTEMQFTIDVSAPQVTLTGVENYDVTDQSVTIESLITDEFFASKRVSVTGSVTDATGKVAPITITDFDAAVNPTTINKVFSDDGIYDLTITATDVAGNSTSQSVHFTIDKTAPVIGDLSAYDGAVLTEFVWDIDLDELVSDLTVCDVHMYLNGTEYYGEEEIADGSYVLLITAEDDLGHKVEKSVEFILDTKAPVFIVTGVEDEEVKDEPYEINVSLQLEEDILTSVTLNGKVITITNNVANISVTEKGDYTLVMTAVDAAGNEVSETIEFRLGQEAGSWLWLILLIIAVLLVLVIIFIIVKRRKDNDRNIR